MIFGVPFVDTQRGVGVVELDDTWMMLCAFEGEFEYQGGETEQEVFRLAADACVYLQSPPSLRFEFQKYNLLSPFGPDMDIHGEALAGYVFGDVVETASGFTGVGFITVVAGFLEYMTFNSPAFGELAGSTGISFELDSAYGAIEDARDDAVSLSQSLVPSGIHANGPKPVRLEGPPMSHAHSEQWFDDVEPFNADGAACTNKLRNCMNLARTNFKANMFDCKALRFGVAVPIASGCLAWLALPTVGLVVALQCIFLVQMAADEPYRRCVRNKLAVKRAAVLICYDELDDCCRKPGTECIQQ